MVVKIYSKIYALTQTSSDAMLCLKRRQYCAQLNLINKESNAFASSLQMRNLMQKNIYCKRSGKFYHIMTD